MKKKIWAIIIILVLITGIWGVRHFLRRNMPEFVINRMLKNLYLAKALHYELKVDVEGKLKAKPLQLNINLKGDLDKAEFADTKTGAEMEANLGTSTGQLNMGGDIFAAKDRFYLKFKNFPQGLEALRIFSDSWIKFSFAELKLKNKIDDSGITPIKLGKLVHDTKFISKYNELPEEEINGINCRHYLVRLDNKACTGFVQKLDKLARTQPDADAGLKIQDSMERLDNLTAELWIGKKDNYLYKAKTLLSYNYGMVGEKISLPVEAIFSNYNQPVSLKEPEGAKESPGFLKTLFELIILK